MTRNPAKNFDCNTGVYMFFCKILMRENDVTPSNIMEMGTDVTKKMTPRLYVQWYVAEWFPAVFHCGYQSKFDLP